MLLQMEERWTERRKLLKDQRMDRVRKQILKKIQNRALMIHLLMEILLPVISEMEQRIPLMILRS